MNSITLSKTKYIQLQRQAQAYQKFIAKFFEFVIKDPVGEVMQDFQETNLYTNEFLKDLETGLRKSSYVKKYGD